jgi:hypothetical protein
VEPPYAKRGGDRSRTDPLTRVPRARR